MTILRLPQSQSDGYLVIIQPKQVEVAEIQESLLSKHEYQQFRSLTAAAAAATADESTTDPTEAKTDAADASVEVVADAPPQSL